MAAPSAADSHVPRRCRRRRAPPPALAQGPTPRQARSRTPVRHGGAARAGRGRRAPRRRPPLRVARLSPGRGGRALGAGETFLGATCARSGYWPGPGPARARTEPADPARPARSPRPPAAANTRSRGSRRAESRAGAGRGLGMLGSPEARGGKSEAFAPARQRPGGGGGGGHGQDGAGRAGRGRLRSPRARRAGRRARSRCGAPTLPCPGFWCAAGGSESGIPAAAATPVQIGRKTDAERYQHGSGTSLRFWGLHESVRLGEF
ncbi:translation initiation factor IF-2 [Panthera uncia]|uniref:translation initiation factor IF-2 n=1 Tax=Panthera uncia TaxID=29064 RepID=UPI0020FFE6F1|nr:translation initiation factor IF-2 [Panthera uncia]